MGTIVNTNDFRRGGDPPAASRGGKRLQFWIGKVTMSASYATGGDTLQIPAPTGMSLKNVIVNNFPGVGVDRILGWDGSVSAPKIHASVISTGAQVANTTDLSAVTTDVVLVFEG